MKVWIIKRLPKDKWHTCPSCSGTGLVQQQEDLHRSAGTIPCPNHCCEGGMIKSILVEEQ
jgi:transcription elongation factor Elf1